VYVGRKQPDSGEGANCASTFEALLDAVLLLEPVLEVRRAAAMRPLRARAAQHLQFLTDAIASETITHRRERGNYDPTLLLQLGGAAARGNP
jgi:hypothetical protein